MGLPCCAPSSLVKGENCCEQRAARRRCADEGHYITPSSVSCRTLVIYANWSIAVLPTTCVARWCSGGNRCCLFCFSTGSGLCNHAIWLVRAVDMGRLHATSRHNIARPQISTVNCSPVQWSTLNSPSYGSWRGRDTASCRTNRC